MFLKSDFMCSVEPQRVDFAKDRLKKGKVAEAVDCWLKAMICHASCIISNEDDLVLVRHKIYFFGM